MVQSFVLRVNKLLLQSTKYGGKEVIVNIETLSILMGKIQPRALGMVIEWAALHQQALKTNWEEAGHKELLDPIPPLQ